MANKQLIKKVFDKEFNKDKIHDQILLNQVKKKNKCKIQTFKYAIFVFIIVLVGCVFFLNSNNSQYKTSDNVMDSSSIVINKVDNINITKLDMEIKQEEFNNVNLPWFEIFDGVEIPEDLDKFYGYGVYTKNDSTGEYDIFNSYVYEYFNLEENRKVRIAFSEIAQPIRDYFFDTKESKKSNINNHKLIIYQNEDTYFVEFEYNKYYFDIETNGITVDELTTLLSTIIK